MTFPLPRRYWYPTAQGWASRPWLLTEYREAQAAVGAPAPLSPPDTMSFDALKALFPQGIPT